MAPPRPAPVVRVTNVRPPTPAAPPEPPPIDDERYFPEEGSPEGCASGECLPDEPPAPEPTAPKAAPAPPASMAISGRDNPRRPLQERWRAAVDTMRQGSGRHAKSLACGRLLWIREGEVAIAYTPKDGFHKSTVSGSGRTLVEKALAEHFGRPTKLVVQDCAEGDLPSPGGVETGGAETGGTGLISIAEQDASEKAAYEKSTEGRVRAHPALRSALRLLGGEIEHIQVYEVPVRPVAAPTSESPDESP
ncbi:MAG: DNA polymerase III subunit gamma/tau [Cystobacter sp.]